MRASEIREMSPQERINTLDDLVEEYRGLRFGHVMQQVSNPLRLREVRRDIARLKTIIAEEASRAPVETAPAEGEEA
jgi:large subunit ribosomal protein L29